MPGRLIVFVVLAFCCVLSASVAVALMSPSIVAAQADARDARATAAAPENVCHVAIRAMAAAAVPATPGSPVGQYRRTGWQRLGRTLCVAANSRSQHAQSAGNGSAIFASTAPPCGFRA